MGIFKLISNMIKEEFDYRKKLAESYKRMSEDNPETFQKEPIGELTESSAIKSQTVSQFNPHTQVRTDTYTVYYTYGHVQNVFPPLTGGYYENRDIINAANFIVSDGVAYDLTDKKSIYSIKVPNYHIYAPNKVGEELGVTGCLDYVLRMHAGLCWGKDTEIALACLEKATQLMKYSTVGWMQKDFYRNIL